jgi:hypothetical protein
MYRPMGACKDHVVGIDMVDGTVDRLSPCLEEELTVVVVSEKLDKDLDLE